MQRLKSAGQPTTPALKHELVRRWQMHVINTKVKDLILAQITRNLIYSLFIDEIILIYQEVMGWKDDVEDRNMVELLTTIFLIIRWYSAYQRWQMLSKEIMKTKYKDCIDRMIKIVEEDDDNDDWFPLHLFYFNH